MNCRVCESPLHWDKSAGEYTTLVGWSSPPGHDHDDNCIKRVYVCDKGHSVTLSLRRRCPKCEWVGKPDCFCHSGAKVDAWPI